MVLAVVGAWSPAARADGCQLDLFVIAGERAQSDALRTVFCERVTLSTDKLYDLESPYNPLNPDVAVAHGETSYRDIGHPGVRPFLRNGSVITRLPGWLAPDAMTNDLRFQWAPFRGCQHQLYSYHGAALFAVMGASAGLVAFLLVAFLAFGCWLETPVGRRRFLRRLVVPAALVVAVAGLGFYVWVEKTEVRVGPPAGWYRCTEPLAERVQPLVRSFGVNAATPLALAKIEAAVQRAINRQKEFYRLNRYFGDAVRREVSPGNYDIVIADGNVDLYFFDEDAVGHRLRIVRQQRTEKD